jgi:hypothetical protein
MSLIGLGLQALPAIYQGITAIKQNRLAKKIDPKRPTMTTPKAMQQAVGLAQQRAMAGMPGMGQAQNNLRASTANLGRAASMTGSSSNALAALAAGQSNQNQGMNQLAVQNANFRNQGMANLQGQLGQLGQQQMREFDYNQNQPYQQQAAAKSALRQASMTNANTAFGTLAGAGMNYMNAVNGNPFGGANISKLGGNTNQAPATDPYQRYPWQMNRTNRIAPGEAMSA